MAASSTKAADKGRGCVLNVYNVADRVVGAKVRLIGPLSKSTLANVMGLEHEGLVVNRRGKGLPVSMK
jgi:hypothetical protein